MHEQAIAGKIIAEAESYGTVEMLTVECGALAPIPAAELEQALKQMARFRVTVVEKPARVQCMDCGHTGRPRIALHSHDATVFFCAKCGAVPKLLSGRDIVMSRIVMREQ
jgi:Zn finger protein HypA/HybF involved in hydrogenase expression